VARRPARETCSPTHVRCWHSTRSCVDPRVTTRAHAARGRSSHAKNCARNDDMPTFPLPQGVSPLHSRATVRPRKLPMRNHRNPQSVHRFHDGCSPATVQWLLLSPVPPHDPPTVRTCPDDSLPRSTNLLTMHAFSCALATWREFLPWLLSAATGSRTNCKFWCLGAGILCNACGAQASSFRSQNETGTLESVFFSTSLALVPTWFRRALGCVIPLDIRNAITYVTVGATSPH